MIVRCDCDGRHHDLGDGFAVEKILPDTSVEKAPISLH